MTDFSFTISDSTKVANCLLWDGIIRAEDEAAARSLADEKIIDRVCRETGLPAPLLRVSVVEVVPYLAPDFCAEAS